jgi:hypothetical protein
MNDAFFVSVVVGLGALGGVLFGSLSMLATSLGL